MNTRVIITTLCLVLACAPVFAETKDSAAGLISPASEFPSAAGAFGSSMLGGGLSYQRWFGTAGIAVTAGGMAYPYSDGGVYPVIEYTTSSASVPDFMVYNYNVQVDLLLKLYSSNFWNWLSGDLYAFLTLAHMGSAGAVYVDKDGDPDTYEDDYYKAGPYVPVFAVGVGIGYEIVLFRHFSVPLQFGYMAEYPISVGFNFSGGLRYRF
jgi:hypothetical protein